MENSFVQLIKYFSHNSRPVSRDEFRDFWGACTFTERAYFRCVDLTTGLVPEWVGKLPFNDVRGL